MGDATSIRTCGYKLSTTVRLCAPCLLSFRLTSLVRYSRMSSSSVPSSSSSSSVDDCSGKYNKKHALNSAWTLWYHDTEEKRWDIDSYVKVYQISTIEAFWGHHKALPSATFHMGMFFYMRDDILPIWEDARNKNGGCLSYKVPMADAFKIWEALTVHLAAECLSTEAYLVNGISISPKRGFCILKIWINDHKKYGSRYLNETVNGILDYEQSIFTAWSDKK